MQNGATGHVNAPAGGSNTGFLPNNGHVVQNGAKRILCIADVRGNLKSLNDLAAQARADYIIHTGDFGFYDEDSLKLIADKTLKHVAQYSPLLSENQKRIIQSSQPQQYDVKARFSPHELQLSELGHFISGQLKLNVPVYTVWGACEDVRVLEKFRSGEYKVQNLHIIDEASSRLLELGGVKLRLLGLGGAVVMHKLFDNGDGRTTIAGGQGTMWTTLLQMGELVDTANRVYDPTETRLFVTHASPAREGLLNQLSVTLKADFSISAGLHFRYGSSYNEFSVNPTLDHYRGKLAASKASFNDVWETVRGEVEPAVAQNEAQQTLLNNALDIVTRMPSVANGGNPFGGGQVPAPGGVGAVDESAFKNMWNFNLADAAFGYLVLEIQDGRIGTEMRAQGFNFAHRSTGGKPPLAPPLQSPAQPGPPHAVMQGMGSSNSRAPTAPSSQAPQQVNQSAQPGPQPRNQQPPPQSKPGPPAQQPSQTQQNTTTPNQTRATPSTTGNASQQHQVKPATPQPPAPNNAGTSSPKPATPAKSEAQANGTSTHEKVAAPAEKPASPAVEKKPNSRLFLPNVEGEQAARDSFADEDKAKIIKMETIGHKANHVIHFSTHEEAEAAMKRQKSVTKQGSKGTSTARWFQEQRPHPGNKIRESTGGQGAGTWQASNRSATNSAPRPGYQSGASDSEGGRGRGGFQGRGRGRGSERGRGSGRGGRGGHKGGEESSTIAAPVQQENKPPAATAAPQTTSASDEAWTTKHEAGRCAIRGQCGKKSFFGGELPCPDNGMAEEPAKDTREKLVNICGDDWSKGEICCDNDQIDALSTNLKRAEPIISSCPACRANFFNLFCTFTCSPDQSLFVNITSSQKASSGKLIVTELDNLWSNSYGRGFFDSCKDVKFGATGGKAMDFIGGGAKNYTSFLKFLGDEKLLGSPFQINFPRPATGDFKGMKPMDPEAKACNSTEEAYRCACVDCPGTCPELAKVTQQDYCHVGALPCLSFAVILVYCILLTLFVAAISAHVAYQKHSRRKSERLQLLQDAALSDDEDEDDLVQNAGILDRPQRLYKLNTICDNAFSHLGRKCARYPLITISVSVLIVAVLSIGWISFDVETNPVRLWVSPDSAAAKEKQFFDDNFGPFYRVEQAFLVNDTLSSKRGQVLSYDTLAWWFDVEGRVQRMISPKQHVALSDVCFNPTGNACVVQSLTGYFGGSFASVDPETWRQDLKHCAEQPGSQECLPAFQQPLSKDMVLGGIQGDDVLSAEALIVTWVVNNHEEGSAGERRAMDWEEGLRRVLQDAKREAKEHGLRLSFTTEMSLESELNKSTNTDAKIVVISYVVMFLYASLALGSTTLSVKSIMQNPATAMVQSKFTLGIMGIVIVLMSVSASVGLFSACGIKVTLIIAEVIPFLVLAVGVDNIFLIVHEFERVNISHPDEDIQTRIAKALGRMGPSILLSASTETIAFTLGAAVGMPAVRNFAVYAAGAVLVNALLQVTMFVSVLALNQQRVEEDRADCFPFVKVKRAKAGLGQSAGAYGYGEEGSLQRFIRKFYAPALLNKKVKVGIVVGFLGLFTAGLALIPEVALGLDQRIAFPRDSYLISYFNDLDAYFNTGPPVYFVVRDLPVTERKHQQELCGRYSSCKSYSLTNILEQESKRPEVSYITGSTASWLDDYFTWLNPTNEECCVEDGRTCFESRDPPWNVTLYGMPEGDEFVHYLIKWISSPTNEDCPFGGAAPYSNAVVITPNNEIAVPASLFRTSHTPLRSQADFISAYGSARRISDNISREQNIKVFPYSKFYIFFDQYASIIRLTGMLLGSAVAIIFVLTSLLLGSISTGLVVTLTVAMTVVDIIGVMALANVSLNAISLVNLVISVGISVEFCAHIARAYSFPSNSIMEKAHSKYRGRDLRAWSSLVNVGGSVFSGITVTKFLGVFVLAFTRSKIFEVYYFRIWLALVVLAAVHALVWLPVALSLVGGEGYADPESDGSLEDDLAARRYRALLPPDDDDYDSDDY
ncbi:MAG: hypothetical protein Q9217_003566 [Psora testacea]